MERRQLIRPSIQPVKRRIIHYPLAGVAPPVETWPRQVYGFHPRFPTQPICIQRETPGYYEVSPEIDPVARNREKGVDQALAEAIIQVAFAPGGHAWVRSK